MSCGKQNVSDCLFCTGCGTQLPAPNEYTITTIQPAAGINSQQLVQRKKQIQARNLRDGFLRNRADVEAEITQRQQPSPQQVHHARQVPVQGKCPKCGNNNPSGSKFCNQCGTPL